MRLLNRRWATMAGYNHRGMVFLEVKDLLSEEELIEVAQQERQEREGNIPKRDFLTELYQEFENISAERMTDETETIGILTAIKEGEDREEILRLIANQIQKSVTTISEQREAILHDRKTAAELKRISR